MRGLFLLGRVLFSLLFIIKPIEHFSQKTLERAAEMGAPSPDLFVPMWGILALLGGLSLLLGFKAKVGAWLLILFLLPVTFYMHPFWRAEDVMMNAMQGYCFWKNIALIGALLMISYTGSGPYSLKE